MRNTRPMHLVLLAAAVAVSLTAVVVAQQGVSDDVDGYFSWTRLNPQRNFIESAHPAPKDVYVNDTGVQHALDRAFPFAEGTVLVKEVMDDDGLQVAMLPSMRKVAGFDPDGNDWQYAMFERQDDGSFAGEWVDVGTDMHAMCSSCHANASDNDYAFLTYME
jgi:hypothetical protein